MRLAQEAREQSASAIRQQEIERRQRELERKRLALEAQLAAQRAQFEAEKDELEQLVAGELAAADRLREMREEMARSRKADESRDSTKNGPRRVKPQGGRK
jgi:circadian clock protein KaiC